MSKTLKKIARWMGVGRHSRQESAGVAVVQYADPAACPWCSRSGVSLRGPGFCTHMGLIPLSDLPRVSERSLVHVIEIRAHAQHGGSSSARPAKDKDKDVRWRVARNPATRPEALVYLSRDEDAYVRWCVADNPSAPPEALARLAEDETGDIRSRVATNPSTPPEILARLARGKDLDIRSRVAAHPSTPPEVLALLAEDKEWFVRSGIAENPAAPPEVLAKLIDDPKPNVREALWSSPAAVTHLALPVLEEALRRRGPGVLSGPLRPFAAHVEALVRGQVERQDVAERIAASVMFVEQADSLSRELKRLRIVLRSGLRASSRTAAPGGPSL